MCADWVACRAKPQSLFAKMEALKKVEGEHGDVERE